MRKPRSSIQTRLARALSRADPATDALLQPLHLGTSFLRDPADPARRDRSFRRDDNPTFLGAEALIAELEGAAGALLFASGMAAASALLELAAPGDAVVVPTGLYYGLKRWLAQHGPRRGLTVRHYRSDDLDDLRHALAAGPARIVWLESPSNPLWVVTDLAVAARLAREAGALTIADNTVATPILTRPLDLGVGVVLHSASKYLNGHGDVVLGALAVAAERADLLQPLADLRNDWGAVPGPFEAYLLLRGLRTLPLRMERASATALRVAQWLEASDEISRVHYPGLPGDPGHAVAARQMQGGFGAMLSFIPQGGAARALRLVQRIAGIRSATSFGGLESVIEQRRSMEGPESDTPPDLLRLSIGLETPDDLIAELAAAFAASREP